jgi:hypothetical protein
MIVLNLGVLLHPRHDDFEREQAGLPDMGFDELMDENKREHIADIYEKDRKTSVSLPPAPCVGECKEVRFRGPTLRTETQNTSAEGTG